VFNVQKEMLTFVQCLISRVINFIQKKSYYLFSMQSFVGVQLFYTYI